MSNQERTARTIETQAIGRKGVVPDSEAVAFGSERMAAADLDGRSRGTMAPAGSGDPRIQTGIKEGCD